MLVEVKEDSGSDANWISAGVAAKLAVRPLAVGLHKEFVCPTGTSYVPSSKVKISLIGATDKVPVNDFFIAPDNFPFSGIVVGKPFIREYGHPHKIFPEKEADEFLLMMQKQPTVGVTVP